MRGVPRDRRAISAAPSSVRWNSSSRAPRRDDQAQFLRRVEYQPQRDAEAVAQRGRQQAGAGGGADQRERRQVDAHAARGGAVADDQVELEILHRRIQHFLDRRLQAVDLVDEQHVFRLQVGQDRGEVAGLGDHRAGGGAEADAQLARDDLRERGLAEAGRAVQQHVVERLAAVLGGLDEDRQVLARGLLAGEVGEGLRPQRGLGRVLRQAGGGNGAISESLIPSPFAPDPSGCHGSAHPAWRCRRGGRATRATACCASGRR